MKKNNFNKKNHIVFVNPSFVMHNEMTRETYIDFPLNLALLASILIESGYTVDIHNANIHCDWEERTLRSLKRKDIAYVGFSCMSSQIKSAITLCKKIKDKFPDVPVVFGGVHPTLLPDSLVKTPWVDFCVVGEGDAAVGKLVQYFNDEVGIESIPNIVTFKNGSIVQTSKAPQTGFDGLPDAMHESLYMNEMDKYAGNYDGGLRHFQLLTGLGCNYHCAFCINHLTKRKYRSKAAKTIYKEMKFLKEKYNINYFTFQEEHFFSDQKRLLELLELIENDPGLYGKIKWTTTVRVSDYRENYLNIDLLKRLVRSGCKVLGVGGESGSDKVLKLLKKGTTRKFILRSAKFTNEAKLPLSYSFVMLWPGETIPDMIETARVIDKIYKAGPYSTVPFFQTYRPYPGSIWEPELSPFNDPESLPDSIWRFQLIDKKHLKGFEDVDFVYNLISVTQVFSLLGFWLAGYELYGLPTNAHKLKALVHKFVFELCRLRIRHAKFKFLFEKPLISYFQKHYCTV